MSTKVKRRTCTECNYQIDLGEPELVFCPRCQCDDWAWKDEA